MTCFSRQSGCTRLRLDTFVSRRPLTAIAVRRLPFTMVSPSAQRSDCSGLFFFRRGQMAEIRGQLPCCSFRNGVGAAVLSVITASDAAVFAVRRPLKTCIFTHKNVRIRPLNIRLCWISYYTTHTQYTIPIILM